MGRNQFSLWMRLVERSLKTVKQEFESFSKKTEEIQKKLGRLKVKVKALEEAQRKTAEALSTRKHIFIAILIFGACCLAAVTAGAAVHAYAAGWLAAPYLTEAAVFA